MKERLDVLLVKRNLAESREKAKAIIMSGNVFVNGNREDKAGTTFDEEKAQIEIKGHTLPYVSRGGLKLEKAIEVFGVDVKGKVCMDIGASTGGFTDCMLQYVTSEQIPEKIDFASVDVSFISLKKVLGPARELLQDDARMVCLIKPQFEAGREKVGKKGVVRDKAVHLEVIEMILQFVTSIHFEILNLDYSPIKGPEGNIEYLVYIRKRPEDYPLGAWTVNPAEVVDRAHEGLAKG